MTTVFMTNEGKITNTDLLKYNRGFILLHPKNGTFDRRREDIKIIA